MNSMRYLILLAFVLYETQHAQSTKPIKYIASLISRHFKPTTEKPIPLEELLYPVNNCDTAKDGAAPEWNDQVLLPNGNLNNGQFFGNGNLGIVPSSYYGNRPIQNPQAYQPEEQIMLIKEDTDTYENPELYFNLPQKPELVKDQNTEWLLNENSGEKEPETVNVNPVVESIKEKIINKINDIKFRQKFKNHSVRPIVEVVAEDSSFPFEENQSTTAQQPIISEKPDCTSVKTTSTEIPIITVKPVTAVGTTATAEPIPCSTPTHATGSTIHVTTGSTAGPTVHITSSSTAGYTPQVTPFSTTGSIAQGTPSSTTEFTAYVPSTTTEIPDCDTPEVDVNVASKVPVITIPYQYHIALPPQNVYYSPLPYQVFLNNCPPPLTLDYCYRSKNAQYAAGPTVVQALPTNQMTLDNMPYNVPKYQKPKTDFGPTKVVNYIRVDARLPFLNPTGTERQWINYAYNGQKPVYQGTQVYQVPVQETSVYPGPVQQNPAYQGPVQKTPVYQGPVQETPVYQGPVQETPVYQGPVQETPMYQGPTQQNPVYQGPVQNIPVYQGPIQETPVPQNPNYQGPVQETPMYQGPIQQNPVYQGPVQNIPVYQGPIQETPVQQNPNYQGPVQETPVYQGPVSSYMPQTSPNAAFPSSGTMYPTPETVQPIAVYATGDSALPTQQTEIVNPEDVNNNNNWNQYNEIEPATNNVEGSADAPLRGDIRFAEDYNTANAYQQQLPGGEAPYTLKERRNAASNNGKQILAARKNDQIPIPASKISVPGAAPVFDPAETKVEKPVAEVKTPTAKPKTSVKTPVVAEAKAPTTAKTETPVNNKMKTPRPTSDDINLELVKKKLADKSA